MFLVSQTVHMQSLFKCKGVYRRKAQIDFTGTLLEGLGNVNAERLFGFWRELGNRMSHIRPSRCAVEDFTWRRSREKKKREWVHKGNGKGMDTRFP